jgi:EmrB/QacA subfamily drug resistance transporter
MSPGTRGAKLRPTLLNPSRTGDTMNGSTSPDNHNPHHARRWLILAVLGVAQLMVVLDATIVNIALPSAQKALGFSDDSRQWIVTAYALAFGSLLPLGGRLSDLLGQKRMFLIGASGFALASAVGGAAGSFTMLVASRAIQGIFAAMLAPASLSLVSGLFTDSRERGKAFGIYGAIAGGGGAVGLLLGGVLTEYASWRWCLYVNLGFAIPAACAATALLHHLPRKAMPSLDIPGVITASAGLFSLVYGFSNAETTSWGNPLTVGFLCAGVVILALFVMIEQRVSNPLVPLRIVTDRTRAGAYLAVLLSGAGVFGAFLFLTYYMQQTLGYSPVKTGLAFLPMTGVLMLSAAIASNRVLPRVGPKPVVAVGSLLAAGGMLTLTKLGVTASYAADVLPGVLLVGAGMGCVMAVGMSTATLGVRTEDSGVASSLVNTGQQIGGSLGTALLSTFATTAATHYMQGRPHTPAVAAHAAVHGYTTAFWISAGIYAAAAVIAGLLIRRGVPKVAPGAQPAFAH